VKFQKIGKNGLGSSGINLLICVTITFVPLPHITSKVRSLIDYGFSGEDQLLISCELISNIFDPSELITFSLQSVFKSLALLQTITIF
jgi:uncharacterized membrane protein YhaH (DUF805 family)